MKSKLIILNFITYFIQVNVYVIKEIDNFIYVGRMNSLTAYSYVNKNFEKEKEKVYTWEAGIMNGSDAGLPWHQDRWPPDFPRGPSSLSFDNCLNWKQEHPNQTVRDTGFDFPRWYYHSPSGDFKTMNYTCMNSFIKAIEPLGNDKLWVCGTFGAFPRAFSVTRSDLAFVEFVDKNIMSCARYVDEPMATFVNNVTKELYVASGWGLYRPSLSQPDIMNNNSTMLYSQWGLYRNLYTVPAALGLVLSSDVNFIDVVKETANHIYFFGHEINSQYGSNNQEDRNAWQSFMLRICKNDRGFKYSPFDDLNHVENHMAPYYAFARFGVQDFQIAPTYNELNYIPNLPLKQFVTSMKINFGCYISKRPRAISDNHFWGETNVVYLNKLVDVVFDPARRAKFKTKNVNNSTGCNGSPHSQIPLLGLFNGPGIVGTALEPTGALCQLQVNENIFVEQGRHKHRYSLSKTMEIQDAFDELMAISSTSTSNFYEKNLQRTNGFTMYPWTNQGVMIGKSNIDRNSFRNMFYDVGQCHDKAFYDGLNQEKFLWIQNFTNTAWPNEMANRLTSMGQALCQYTAAELFNFNATFVEPGVEFKKMFVIADNITNYKMHNLENNEDNEGSEKRRFTSPLMVVGIISTSGVFYRVVICDFDSGIINRGPDHTSGEWYNWCIFRHTDQPYLYRQFIPMEKRERGEPALYRASSLLKKKNVVSENDLNSFPKKRDPQFHVVKAVLRKNEDIHVVTTSNIIKVSLDPQCSNYDHCIDCASDPFCMWRIENKTCMKYEQMNYTDSTFVQDVLDRGYKCLDIIDPTIGREAIANVIVSDQFFHCSNYGLCRGKIVWKISSKGSITDFKNTKGNYVVDDKSIYVTKNFLKDVDYVRCYCVNDDFDKLYGGKEYSWITKFSQRSICLNTFKIDPTVSRQPVVDVAVSDQLLNCSNYGLCRGKIVWRINSNGSITDFTNSNGNYVVDDKSLNVTKIFLKDVDYICCYCVNDDLNKLYGGKEYSWIIEFNQRCLNMFKINHVDPTIGREAIENIYVSDQLLNCSNYGLCRGKIVWRINSNGSITDFVNADESYVVDDKFLNVTKIFLKHIDYIYCYCVDDDLDKLYGGKEFAWIIKFNPSSICLNMFKINHGFGHYIIWIWILSILIIVLLVVFCIVLYCYLSLWRRKSKNKYGNSPVFTTEINTLVNCNVNR